MYFLPPRSQNAKIFIRPNPLYTRRKFAKTAAMKTNFAVLAAGLVCLALLVTPAAAKPTADDAQLAKTVPGAEKVAQTISQITGVAVSPLLGVGAVGAWQYFHAQTPAQKAKLPWYADPLFWVPAMLIVGVCFIKDTAGTALPTAVKKPMDVIETCEHKISGLVATGAFVPIAASIFHSSGNSSASLAALGFAGVDLHWLYNALMVPVAMAAFFIVFLASNAINILILLSPFTTVDLALKSLRAALLASITATAFMNPWLGMAWALIIIGISYFIAGWSFRLSHFGLEYVWDFFTLRRHRFTPDAKENKVFLGRKINKVPARTYGKLVRDEWGNYHLNYRPWLVLPPRTLALPEGRYVVGKGLFYSEIMKLDGDVTQTALLLPPRYNSHEEQLVKIYSFVDVRPVGLLAAWAWFKGLFVGAKPATA